MSARRTPGRRGAARLPRATMAVGALAGALAATGCAGRARPEAALAATRADGTVVPLDSTTSEFIVNGLHVIHRANFATDVVAVRLYLLGGSRQLTPATQGIEALLLRTAEYGTVGYPGARSREAWGDTGSELAVAADVDWTLYGFRGIRSEFDRTWDVFADRVMRPELAPANVATVRAKMLTALAQRRTSPDALIFLLADSVAYAGHPYALRPEGTEASLARLDSAALAHYHASQMVTSRMLLVVVGGVERSAVEAAVTRTLAHLPRGDYTWSLPPAAPAPADRSTVT
ncbi:MAG TPA: insulinase family protein, partial [Gemmatimonadaceae bacterium]|nr:insulinase family protein [Gemmatimonadaceae bacterium]